MRERAPKVLRGPVARNKEDDQVVYIDGGSAPRVLFSGEDLLLEDLPIGTRVIYPKPPIEGLANPGAAIRYALNHPLGTDPLYAQLQPGMSVTIAVDDISLPLPPMALPDIRQTIIEILLELLDANGVDDVHIVIANSLHRRLTADEMKRIDDLVRSAVGFTAARGDQVTVVNVRFSHDDDAEGVTAGSPLAGFDKNDVLRGAELFILLIVAALIIFFVVVGIYISIRFEPKMAAAAFIAMVHDVAVAVGIYSIFNFQVTPDTVVAILTILGYSLYDTVVVFDRVRDNTKGIGSSGRLTYPQLINLSMNQTNAKSVPKLTWSLAV